MSLTRRTFTCALAAASAYAKPRWTAARTDEEIAVQLDGSAFSTFQMSRRWDKPFLHPLRTPTKVLVSRGFPVTPLPGESTDHPWHRGLFWGHGLINGHDFWREGSDLHSGFIRLTGHPGLQSSGSAVTLSARFQLQPREGESLGTVDQKIRLSIEGKATRLDVGIGVQGAQPLTFGDTDDGGLGFRFRDEFREDRGAVIRNADGLQTSNKIWGRTSPWVSYASVVDGSPVTVLFADHPSNLRYPTGWHARGYGLCSANPFAAGSFAKNKSNAGNYVLPAGNVLHLQYSLWLLDGHYTPAELAKIAARVR